MDWKKLVQLSHHKRKTSETVKVGEVYMKSILIFPIKNNNKGGKWRKFFKFND